MKRLHGLSGKFAVVAALTCVTMFGTGYAAWHFSQTATETSTNAHAVTNRDPKGELTITKLGNTAVTDTTEGGSTKTSTVQFYFIIDQSELYWSTSNDVNVADGATTETCYANKFSEITLNYVGSGSATKEKITLDTTITYTQGKGTDATSTSGAVTGVSYTEYFTFKTSTQTLDYGGAGKNLEFTYTMPTVSWNDGKKPLTTAAYETMKAALTGATITFTFTASVAE